LKKNKGTATAVSRASNHRSWIFFWLDRLSDAIYKALGNGLFGYIFTAYTQEQASFEKGFVKKHFSESSKTRLYIRTVKKYLSKVFESSALLNGMGTLGKKLTSFSLKAFGSMFFSFGLYVTLMYLIRLFLPVIETADTSVAIIGVTICIISVPMLLSTKNLIGAIGESSILGTVFKETLGFRDETFEVEKAKSKNGIMIVFGMLLGVLTIWVHPLTILAVLALIILLALVMIAPEIGVIIALFALPFFSLFDNPAVVLGILILTVVISYIVKIIRGKRIIKFELIDLSVLVFGVLIFLSGTISSGGSTGFREALLTCEFILGYFLIINLMRTAEWIRRCVWAIVTSGTVVAFIGIAQYFLGIFTTGAWIDREYFYDIKGRTVSLFENPNVLAEYLVIILPFAMYALFKAKGWRANLLGLISVLSILLCIILTWSRAAWLSAIICIFLFFMIYSKKTIRFLFVSLFFVPVISYFLPTSVTRRFLSIGNMTDSSTVYRFYTWRGTARGCSDFFWGGVGYGPTAFQEMYPPYAYAGMEAAEHSHSLYLQILFGMGIFGLLAFAVVILLFLQMNFEYIKNESSKNMKMVSAASICAIVSMLIFGLFDYIWYNYRIFFLFWIILALGCACARIGNDETRRHSYDTNADFTSNE